MQKRHAIIGTYNHLPEGVEESAFEETYQVCWRPYLSTLYRFSDIAATLFYSGTVLRWLEARHPEFIMLLEEMSARKQVELLGGGFFAPILPVVPGQDRLGQIEMLTTFIRKAFGRRPRGCWLQEYAWEPALASTLQTCGFDYTFLSERQFRAAGASVSSPAITEDQGKSIAVFPVFDALESLEKPLPPHEALASLARRAGELPVTVLLYPDRAALPLWKASGLESPDVFWERSFASIQKDSPIIETTTPSRWLKQGRGSERAYFPGSGSALLLERSSTAAKAASASSSASEEGQRGGSPRRILLSSGASSALYAKMHHVRILVGQLRGDKARKKSAQEALWRAQCGDAYWNAPSGGNRRLAVRAAAYASLLEAEKTTRQRGGFSPGIIRADIDFDGEKEILYQGADYNAYLHLVGGVLAEFDSLRSLTNYVNAADPGAAGRILRCFHDSFYDSGGFGHERGSFAGTTYAVVEAERPSSLAVLGAEGRFRLGGREASLALRKSYSFRRGLVSVDYDLHNREDRNLSFRFGVELGLAAGLQAAEVGLSIHRGHDASAVEAGVSESGLTGFRLENLRAGERLELRSDRPFALRLDSLLGEPFPGQNGGPSYQGARALAGWDLAIPAGERASLSLSLELGKI